MKTGQIPVLKLGRRLLVPTAGLRDLVGLTNAELQRQLAALELDEGSERPLAEAV